MTTAVENEVAKPLVEERDEVGLELEDGMLDDGVVLLDCKEALEEGKADAMLDAEEDDGGGGLDDGGCSGQLVAVATTLVAS